MLLMALVFGGGLLYWMGWTTGQQVVTAAGAGALLLALLALAQAGGITGAGWLFLLALALLVWALRQPAGRGWRVLGWVVLIVLVFALGLRVLPFFTPIPTLQTTEHLFRFPPEKIVLLMLLLLLILVPVSAATHTADPLSRQHPSPRPPATAALLIAAVTLAVLTLLAWLLGVITPGWTSQSAPYLAYWLTYNLLYTCVVEESFFRGIVQTGLIRGLHRRWSLPVARTGGIALAALLFGVTHLGGGPDWLVLATLAGLGYGLVYELSGRLYYAVLVHFTVNAVAVLAFAGPLPE